MKPQYLTLLGVGLIGGSIGLAVKRWLGQWVVTGYGNDAQSLSDALKLGAVDRIVADPAQAVRGADLVVLCTPIQAFPDLLPRIASSLSTECNVTDVASTKLSAVRWAEQHLGTHSRFVGSHPMAGSERQGVAAARADLFDGAACLMTPTPHTNPAALRDVADFWKRLRMRCVMLEPLAHDRLMAQISHLPHAMAAALVNLADPTALDLAGRGFADTTRIAAGDADLWTGILLDNRESVLSALERMRDELGELHRILLDHDAGALHRWLQRASRRRAAMAPSAMGGAPRPEST